MNNMMYPDWQYWYWIRSVFWKKGDFEYRDEKTGEEIKGSVAGKLVVILATGVLVGGALMGKDWIRDELPRRLRDLDPKALITTISGGR